MTQQIAKDKVVSIAYELTDTQGTLLDSSAGRPPMPYLHGHGNIIPGLESELDGKSAGEQITVTVPPETAYGPTDPALIQPVPKSQFAGVPNVEVGMQFQASSPQGTRVVRVVDINDDEVTVDANHPLAGKTLTFDVKIADVRDATPDELQQGQAQLSGE